MLMLCEFASEPVLPHMINEKSRFQIQSDADVVAARQKGRKLAQELGFSATDGAFIATAISELSRNILIHAGSGEIVLSVEHHSPTALVVTARDAGPGISDLELAMSDGYSTYGGLGLGLPGTRRLMDEFEIVSRPGAGTMVTVKKILRSV